jgi:hypothetical protein
MELCEGRGDREFKETPSSLQPEALKHISRTDAAPLGRKEESEQNVTVTSEENEHLGAPKMSTARVAVLLGTIWVSHRLLLSSPC